MLKRHLRQVSVALFVFVVILTILPLSACTGNAVSTSPNVTPIKQPSMYNAPFWWNGKVCDQEHYPEAKLLTTWRGIQVCGPIPWKTTGNKDVTEGFHGHGASQLEFECPELIARYLLAAYGLDSQQADGWQIVDAYTSLPGTPFHKVVNNGSIPMAPAEGDVLSYGLSDPGHTSIVTNSSIDGRGNGNIDVIEQNVAESGTATLTMTNWVIQHDSYHIGTVASWMTTRPISSQQPTSVPTTHPPVPTTIPGIDQFVGTWWVGGGAITLTIKSDGSATYVASGGNSKIQFTSVSGNTASGTVVSGTSIPIGPQGNSIPVGGTITVTLVDQHTLQISNGYVLCPNTEQCAN